MARAINGHITATKITNEERRTAVAHLAARGADSTDIADRIGTTTAAVHRDRNALSARRTRRRPRDERQ